MKKIIFYMCMLTIIPNLYSSFIYEEPPQFPADVHFLREERIPTVHDFSLVIPDTCDERSAVPGTVVPRYGTDESENPYIQLSPLTNRHDSSLVPPSPQTPTAETRTISNSEKNCRQVTVIFFGFFGVLLAAGTTYYGYTQIHT